MVFHTYISIAITLLMMICFGFTQYEGQSCTLSSGGKGRCIEGEKCAPQPSSVENGTMEKCENDSKFAICCPLFENIVTPASRSERECLRYSRNIQRRILNIFRNLQRMPIFRSNIVGGDAVYATEFPHMAALGFENENEVQWKCGGTLISKQFILTAAHCVSTTEIGEVKRVRLGDLNLQSAVDDGNIQEFRIVQIFRHPKYVPPALYNDIALVQLDHPVKITAYVSPACLPVSDYVPISNLIATGYGREQFVGSTSGKLMKVALDYFSHELCREAYSNVPNRQLPSGIMDQTQICAGDIAEQKDTCQGDSGGPLQTVDPRNSNLYHIIGITSFGKGCGTSTNPGVYTRVFHYLPWIESIVWSM